MLSIFTGSGKKDRRLKTGFWYSGMADSSCGAALPGVMKFARNAVPADAVRKLRLFIPSSRADSENADRHYLLQSCHQQLRLQQFQFQVNRDLVPDHDAARFQHHI